MERFRRIRTERYPKEKPKGLFAVKETAFSVSMPLDTDELLEQDSDEMVEGQERNRWI